MAIFVPRFLRQLRDIVIATPADGEVLTYDSADQKWKNEAGGGGGGDLTDAVILAPAASARNVIQPTAGAVIAAIVKAHAAQSVNLMEWQDSAGGVLMRVALDGGVLIETNTDFATALVLKSNDPASNQQETFQIKDSSGTTVFEVQNCGETIWRFLEVGQAGLQVIDTVGIGLDLFSLSSFAGGYFRFDTNGALIFQQNAAVADVGITAQELMLWFDPTNGAAKFMLKGKTLDNTVVTWEFEDGFYSPGGGGAPTTADYLVGTAQGGLSAEIVVGTSPGGELGGTWASPTVDATHSGSSHAAVQAAAEATAAAALSSHEADTTSVHGIANTASLYVTGGTDVAVADGGTGSSTAAGARTALDVPSNAEAVLDSLFDANTVLAADADDTPAALTMGASTILARLAAGNIKAATPAELRTLLDVPTTGEAILDTLVDAKGDLIAATAADTVARLAVGTDFLDTLVPSSAAASGLIWAKPRSALRPTGSLYESFGRFDGPMAGVALGSQSVYLQAIDLPSGLTVTSISYMSSAVALAVGVHQFFGLYDSSRNLLRSSVDDTSTAWGTNTVKTLALTSTFVTTYSGLHYIALLIQATTPPTIQSIAVPAAISGVAPIIFGLSSTGQVALPNPAAAITASTVALWCWVS